MLSGSIASFSSSMLKYPSLVIIFLCNYFVSIFYYLFLQCSLEDIIDFCLLNYWIMYNLRSYVVEHEFYLLFFHCYETAVRSNIGRVDGKFLFIFDCRECFPSNLAIVCFYEEFFSKAFVVTEFDLF